MTVERALRDDVVRECARLIAIAKRTMNERLDELERARRRADTEGQSDGR